MSVAINIDKELKEIGVRRDAQIEILKESAREKGVQLLEQYFPEVFAKYPKLTHIYVTGYTPGWNDGEECTHTTQVYIHNDLEGWSELGDFLECYLGWDIDNDNPSEKYAAINAGLTKSECNDIELDVPVYSMSEALGTDWLVIATKDGQVTIQNFEVGY
jgi:hypothetical protein